MRYYIPILLLLFFLAPLSGYGQIARLKHADKLYEKYDYIDAQKVYLEVIEKGYKSAQIYGDLADSYYFQSKYEDAAVWYAKLLEEFSDKISVSQYLRSVQSYKSLKEYEKAEALLKLYKAKFGETAIYKNYEEDPDYLNSIHAIETRVHITELDINVEGSDHSPIFYGEDKIVFSSPSLTNTSTHSWSGTDFLDLFVADRDFATGLLSNKQSFDKGVNSDLHESASVFTKDGKTMYFTRNSVQDSRSSKRKQPIIRLKIYKAQLQQDNSWKVVEALPFNGNTFSTAYPALNAAQDKLYFSSDREGSLGMSDIWYVDLLKDGTYGRPTHLGANINTEAREAFLFIDANDKLYFASDGHLGLGGLDIFQTQLDAAGLPTTISNLGEPFNTEHDDFGLIIEADKSVGYFSSNRKQAGGASDDIYYFVQECFQILKGKVTQSVTGELLAGASVKLFDANRELVGETIVGADASYSFELTCSTEYLLQGNKDGYSTQEVSLVTPSRSGNLMQDLVLELDGPCAANDLGCRLALQPIYFDFDKHNIRPDAAIELAKILEGMRMYPELVIHIESHTDSRGNDAYNMSLSNRRATSTANWLIEQGIDSNRLTFKGYGETQLTNECYNDVPCSIEQHQLNRRSMFIIQE